MKLLFLANGNLGPDNYPSVNSGGSVQTWGLCKELAKRGHQVFIVRRSRKNGEEEINNVKLIDRGVHNYFCVFLPLFFDGEFAGTGHAILFEAL